MPGIRPRYRPQKRDKLLVRLGKRLAEPREPVPQRRDGRAAEVDTTRQQVTIGWRALLVALDIGGELVERVGDGLEIVVGVQVAFVKVVQEA